MGAPVHDMALALAEAGERVTPARRAVLEALAEGEHLTAEDVVRVLRRRRVAAHRATVYRTLEVLERSGAVEHVHLGHGSSVYHVAGRAHHHLVCRLCGKVVEAPADLLGDVARRLHRQSGFVVDARHFALEGRCAACAREGAVSGR